MLRWVGGALFYGGGAAAFAEAVWWEPKRIRVERHSVRLASLPGAFDGFKIAQLSDLHRGRVVGAGHLRKAVRLTNDLRPDLVCLTGDYISGPAKHAASCAEVLGDLRASHGVHAILGNHDHWADADGVSRELQGAGIGVLRNQWTAVRQRDGTLALVGVDDVWEKKADLEQALRGTDPDVPTIVLVHEPDYADRVQQTHADLQLSGHSHGGQVWLPFLGAPVLPPHGRKYPRGWRRLGRLQVYTNRGVGLVPPPVRFNCPPEVALFELRAR